MSEIAKLMLKKVFLDVCMEIEGLCAEIFHFYSRIFADIPEVSHLWEQAARKEESRRKQFEMAFFLMRENEYELTRDTLDQAIATKLKLIVLVKEFKNNNPDLLTAISTVFEIEENLADLHVNTVLKFKDESMRKLFSSMSEPGRNHLAALQRGRFSSARRTAKREGDP